MCTSTSTGTAIDILKFGNHLYAILCATFWEIFHDLYIKWKCDACTNPHTLYTMKRSTSEYYDVTPDTFSLSHRRSCETDVWEFKTIKCLTTMQIKMCAQYYSISEMNASASCVSHKSAIFSLTLSIYIQYTWQLLLQLKAI